MEEYTPEPQESKSDDLKSWFQENLRIVISIAIVIIIAGGIYSYSKRTDSPIVAEQTEEVSSKESPVEVTTKTDDKKVVAEKETKTDVPATKPADAAPVAKPADAPAAKPADAPAVAAKPADVPAVKPAATPAKPAVSPAPASKETETSFVETAGKNDNLTILARRATANYLEKNPDSALTKEHKIYIEDYLRKAIGNKGGVRIGTSTEFSKDLIKKAIAQSKTLNEKQLKNLQKYSARVSTL